MLWIRRPDQFTNPYLWGESGNVILAGFAQRGWEAFFEPVQGYQSITLKAILYSSFSISFLHAPAIAFILTCLVTMGCVIAVALSPTHLRWPWACALACLIIPTGAEAFGSELMSFWWTGLLLLLALTWAEPRQGLRLIYIGFAGLSVPIIVPLAPLFVARAAFERTHANAAAASLAIAIAVVQVISVALSPGAVRTLEVPQISVLLGKFVGYFFAPTTAHLAARINLAVDVGIVAAIILAVAAYALRKRLTLSFWLLGASSAVIVAATAIRLPMEAAFPTLSTPRYFFFPFIILSWLLIWMAAISGLVLRTAVAAAFAAMIAQAAAHWSWRHTPIDWQAHIRACAASDTYRLPLHTSGRLEQLWYVTLTGSQCRRLAGITPR
jgi:hypothetical protein